MAIINKAGISEGVLIQAEHITRAIDALSGGSTDTVVATGSFTGSFTGTINGTITSASYAPNFANTNLTFTGNRAHDTNGNGFELTTDNGAYQQGFLYIDTTKSEVGRGVNYASFGTGGIVIYQSGSQKLNLSNTEIVINEAGVDVDFRVESDTNINMLVVDAGTNRVGIGKASPNSVLDVNGNTTVTGSLTVTGSFLVNGSLTAQGELLHTSAQTLSAGTLTPTGLNRGTVRVDGSESVTLANGTTGQILYILCSQVINPGTTTITPTNAAGFTSIALNSVGDTATLMFAGSTWYLISYYGTTVTP
jgi:hypothetical protein